MRILLLADAYPPEPLVGAFRTRKLACAFSAGGHHVTALVAEAGGTKPTPSEGFRVVVAERHNDLTSTGLTAARPLWSAFKRATASTGEQTSAPLEPVHGRKGLLHALLHVPDHRRFLIPTLVRATKRLMEAGEEFDLIYATAPSFSVHLAALKCSRLLNAPLILEFRDPWRSEGLDRPALSHRLTDYIDRRMESRVTQAAHSIVAVTDGAGAEFGRRFESSRILVCLNGIDKLRDTRDLSASPGRLRITYSGSLYAPRDPRPMLRAIGDYIKYSQLSVTPEIVFVGDCSHYEGVPLLDVAREVGLSKYFRIVPWLSKDSASVLVEQSDLLLLPAQDWIVQIPNKLFDYLGARVPILGVADEDSDTDRLLRRVGGHYVALREGNLGATVAAAMQAALRRDTVGDTRVLAELTVEKQFSRLVKQIETRLG